MYQGLLLLLLSVTSRLCPHLRASAPRGGFALGAQLRGEQRTKPRRVEGLRGRAGKGMGRRNKCGPCVNLRDGTEHVEEQTPGCVHGGLPKPGGQGLCPSHSPRGTRPLLTPGFLCAAVRQAGAAAGTGALTLPEPEGLCIPNFLLRWAVAGLQFDEAWGYSRQLYKHRRR